MNFESSTSRTLRVNICLFEQPDSVPEHQNNCLCAWLATR